MGSGGQNKINLLGQRFGNLVVVEEYLPTATGLAQWVCLCDCDKLHITTGYYLRQGRRKSCGCLDGRLRGNKNPKWTGYKKLSGSYWHRIKQGAEARNLELSISMKYTYEILLKQNHKCALSGIDICLCDSDIQKRADLKSQTASLDRIDSSKGYIEGNVQWVHKDINRIKMNLGDDYFIKLCKMVAGNVKQIK